MTVNTNGLDTSPGSLPWWRAIDNLTTNQEARLRVLQDNDSADYKQLSSGINGVLAQYVSLRDYVYSIPSTQVQNTGISNFAISSSTYVSIYTQAFTVPDGKNYVTAFAQFDFSPRGGPSQYAWARIEINGVSLYGAQAWAGGAGVTITSSRQLSVSPGDVIEISYLTRYSSSSIPASPLTTANLNSTVTFTKV